MKTSDLALVILLAAVSFFVSYWLGNMILGNPDEDTYKITYVDSISSELEEPDLDTFNPAALNPTVEVIIGKCKDGEVYDNNARRCVPKDGSSKTDEDQSGDQSDDGESGGGTENGGEENPENPEENPNPVNPEE